jgi:hypothetical protein
MKKLQEYADNRLEALNSLTDDEFDQWCRALHASETLLNLGGKRLSRSAHVQMNRLARELFNLFPDGLPEEEWTASVTTEVTRAK